SPGWGLAPTIISRSPEGCLVQNDAVAAAQRNGVSPLCPVATIWPRVARAVDSAAGMSARMPPVVEHHAAVHQHIVNAFGILVRFGECSLVRNAIRIEQHH